MPLSGNRVMESGALKMKGEVYREKVKETKRKREDSG